MRSGNWARYLLSSVNRPPLPLQADALNIDRAKAQLEGRGFCLEPVIVFSRISKQGVCHDRMSIIAQLLPLAQGSARYTLNYQRLPTRRKVQVVIAFGEGVSCPGVHVE